MSSHVDAIAGRLSLRAPQRHSLEILDRITQLVLPRKEMDIGAALAAITAEFPGVTDFERAFPSYCFALATGVGKTRLMGAFVAYLHLAHGMKNFFVLAPNLTIYDKLIVDFTPNTPKYVLKGIAEFTLSPPVIVTGENYQRQIAGGSDLFSTTINIFNISKINSEVRGGRSPRIRSFREEIGESYFDYLAGCDDLVLIMDESHRYRASAGVRAINELQPVLGLELTATPFVETKGGPKRFRNIVFDYPLARAMADGFVKEPAVVTREDFSPLGKPAGAIERIKIEDGVRIHESVKVELEAYARQEGKPLVKPLMLVIARDTAHASELMQLIGSDAFFEGRYAGKVIQVDSSVKEEETVGRLLKVEQADEPTEIVVHVNMLKEGWDVKNLYTIVPLRAANAQTLVVQTMGRGLRLPFGQRTGIAALDRLNIIAHDRFQEIVDEARKPGSAIRLREIILPSDPSQGEMVSIASYPRLLARLGIDMGGRLDAAYADPEEMQSDFAPQERELAKLVHEVICELERRPDLVPGTACLTKPEVQAMLVREVERRYRPTAGPDLARLVGRVTELFAAHMIDIPLVVGAPSGDAKSGFHPFKLDVSGLRYDTPSETLWVEHLRTGKIDRIAATASARHEMRLEDRMVNHLLAFDDVTYEQHAGLLHDLAGQAVEHLRHSLSVQDVGKVIALHGAQIARFVHEQMQEHFWQDPAIGHAVEVRRGFTALRSSTYVAPAGTPPLDFRLSPADKSNMARFVFGGFSRCLFPLQKFHSDPERMLAVILEREALKWFRPARGQFHLFYRLGGQHLEYQPDFVAETDADIFIMEPKASDRMGAADVVAKREVAVAWCRHATDYTAGYGGKPWTYLLIPHDAIAENMTLDGLARAWSCR
ncbi:MAG: DEAD/DEAH box helicase family protein [Pseudaminobacter sp.]